MRFEDQTAIVTGAATGIGEGIALLLAEEGASVVVVDVNPNVHHVADAIVARGGRALAVVADVAAERDVDRAVAAAVDTFGGLNVLVNNVGIQDGKGIDEVSAAEWDRTISVNLRSVYLFMHAAVPHLKRAAPAASVVNISSVHAGSTLPQTSSYAASKAGVLGLTRSSALDLAPFGVRVNAVSPGTVGTGMFYQWLDSTEDRDASMALMLRHQPIGRIGTPDDIAEAVAFLASDKASYITAQTLWVDGGQSAHAFMP
ncbi:SDR family NAD(P)-dependent oxidoreductase [Microbacterium sp. GXF0217]